MNRIVRHLACVAAFLCTISATALNAEPIQWTLSEAAGNVQVANSAGVARKASRGMRLPAGDAVVTGPKSRAIIVRGQEFVTIAANSKVSVAVPRQGSKVQIIQTRGNAVYKIQKKSTPHFSTQTPYLAAVVKGTIYSVTVGKSGASVQVIEGAVQVQPSVGDASFIVSPGMIGTVNRDNPARLLIGGTVNQQIDSSKEALTTSSSADSEPVPSFEPADDSASNEISATAMDAVIKTAIPETGIKIADISGGLVSGRSTVGVPGASRADANGNERSAPALTTSGNRNSASIAVNNAGSPNSNALVRNDNGGSGNGTDSGNSNSGSGGGSDGNGNGNSNDGSGNEGSGDGTGDSGGGSDGNGNGNGNSNGGSGDEGSGDGTGGSGNGNNGSGNGDGNGGSGSGNDGSGNGNGNDGSGSGSGSGNGGSGSDDGNNGDGNGGSGSGNGGSGNGNDGSGSGNGNGDSGSDNGNNGNGNGNGGSGNGGSGSGNGNGNDGSGSGNGNGGSGSDNGNNGNGNGSGGSGSGNGGSGNGNGGGSGNGNGGSGNGNGKNGNGNGNGNGGSGGGKGNGNGGGRPG